MISVGAVIWVWLKELGSDEPSKGNKRKIDQFWVALF